jgi:hypothetical protein
MTMPDKSENMSRLGEGWLDTHGDIAITAYFKDFSPRCERGTDRILEVGSGKRRLLPDYGYSETALHTKILDTADTIETAQARPPAGHFHLTWDSQQAICTTAQTGGYY